MREKNVIYFIFNSALKDLSLTWKVLTRCGTACDCILCLIIAESRNANVSEITGCVSLGVGTPESTFSPSPTL